jgi:hypothetical protein
MGVMVPIIREEAEATIGLPSLPQVFILLPSLVAQFY